MVGVGELMGNSLRDEVRYCSIKGLGLGFFYVYLFKT